MISRADAGQHFQSHPPEASGGTVTEQTATAVPQSSTRTSWRAALDDLRRAGEGRHP